MRLGVVAGGILLTGSTFAAVDCETLAEHHARSLEAFPQKMDKKSRLLYPVRQALVQLQRACDDGLTEAAVASTIEQVLEEHLESDTYQVLILAFSWCEPCTEAFPSYASFAKSEKDVTLLFVDADAHPDGLGIFVRERFELPERYALPSYVVLDPEGEALAHSAGRDGLRKALNWLADYRRTRERLLRKSERSSMNVPHAHGEPAADANGARSGSRSIRSIGYPPREASFSSCSAAPDSPFAAA
jgi:hypothetical protein